MTEPTTYIEIAKESMKFSAAHFTIFSATERERLHGHNFSVAASLQAPVGQNGLSLNYIEFKNRLRALCEELDEFMILPARSPYLRIDEEGDYYRVVFNDETMWFLRCDTLLLPMRNSTVEEYSSYLLSRLLEDRQFLDENLVQQLTVKVSSGPGQWGSATWQR